MFTFLLGLIAFFKTAPFTFLRSFFFQKFVYIPEKFVYIPEKFVYIPEKFVYISEKFVYIPEKFVSKPFTNLFFNNIGFKPLF